MYWDTRGDLSDLLGGELWSPHVALGVTTPRPTYLLAVAFCFAQRLRCASAIFFRDAALSLRLLRTTGVAVFLVPSLESRARALSN